MGNEMGNNNVIGQQVSGESAEDFDKTMHHSNCPPRVNNINDKEEDAKDADIKAHLISNGGDEKMTSDQTKISAANEDMDEKNRGSLQDHASQEDNGNSNLRTKEGDETQEDNATEITTNSTEKVGPVGRTIQDMASYKDTSSSDEQLKQLLRRSTEESEDSTLANPSKLSEENFEGLPEEEEESCSQEVAVIVGNLVKEHKDEKLEEGQTRVSTIYDPSTPPSVQGETISSTAPILTDCHDAELKDVVIQDEHKERGNPSYGRPKYDTNQETYKNEEKQQICETGQFQSALAGSSATDGNEFQKHELSIATAGVMSDSGSAEMEHNAIEEQGVTVDKDVADKSEADSFEGDKKSDDIHDVVNIVKDHSKYFTGLVPQSSGPLPILNEEELQEEDIIEQLAAPMTATSFALQLVEDSVKQDIKFASSDINEGISTSTYEAKTIDTRETTNNSQCDKPQQEEPKAVKFENSETRTTCMKLVECSSATESAFPNVCRKEREGASDKADNFTSESNEKKVTWIVGFAAESIQKEVIANADKFSEEQCLLQKPTLGRDAGEETPLLVSAESINSSSYSSEQHIKAVKDIPMTSIVLIQAKHEAVEESEKSPLLSPREPSEGALRAPNRSARKDKPLHILMAEDRVGRWSSLKEEEPVRKNSTTVSSPRSKEKQKPKSSLFAICMCCTATTN